MPQLVIAEDDPLISRMYEKAFLFEKYNVALASNGEEALEHVKNTKPDLILLDIMMPKKNGLEVLDALKADESTKSIPVIMLTNLSGEHDIEEALQKGAVKYIVKSEFTPKDVVNQVKEVLAGYIRDNLPPTV